MPLADQINKKLYLNITHPFKLSEKLNNTSELCCFVSSHQKAELDKKLRSLPFVSIETSVSQFHLNIGLLSLLSISLLSLFKHQSLIFIQKSASRLYFNFGQTSARGFADGQVAKQDWRKAGSSSKGGGVCPKTIRQPRVSKFGSIVRGIPSSWLKKCCVGALQRLTHIPTHPLVSK